MYTHRLPFYIPKRVPAVAHPRSTRTHFRKSLASRGTRCRSVFVLVAFPPPPVYVLDNEAQPKLSGVRYPEVDHSSRAPSRFYPRGSDESADSSCASLSASAGASVAATLPLVAVLKHRVAAMLADLLAGHGSRENRDGSRTIRRRTEAVKTFFRKNFPSVFRRFFALSPHSKSSSSGDFHRWKFHARTVEKLARENSFRWGEKNLRDEKNFCPRPLLAHDERAARPLAARRVEGDPRATVLFGRRRGAPPPE